MAMKKKRKSTDMDIISDAEQSGRSKPLIKISNKDFLPARYSAFLSRIS
jgi:hypothetical protein